MRALVLHPVRKGADGRDPRDALAEAVSLAEALDLDVAGAEVVPLAKKIISLPQFNRSETHVAYAVALSHTGYPAEAENEFKKMKAKYSNYAARLEYARFLDREGRTEEGLQMLEEIVREGRQLSGQERYANRAWLEEARTELRNASPPPR